jgi:hypothetical protein
MIVAVIGSATPGRFTETMTSVPRGPTSTLRTRSEVQELVSSPLTATMWSPY